MLGDVVTLFAVQSLGNRAFGVIECPKRFLLENASHLGSGLTTGCYRWQPEIMDGQRIRPRVSWTPRACTIEAPNQRMVRETRALLSAHR